MLQIRIHMFLGLLDPEPDPDLSIILLSSSKNSKKNLYCFVTSFGLFIFEK
jgi:hypothetical protein